MCLICSSRDAVLRDAAAGTWAMPSSASVLGAMPLAGMSEAGDAAGSVATAASMDVGTIFDGTIGTSSDSDWIEVTLEAGETYVFLAWGTGGQSAGLADTTLALRDATGAELRRNDDISSGDNHFSSLSLTPGATGTYYVDVSSQDGGTGQYRVVATPDIAPAEISRDLHDRDRLGFADAPAVRRGNGPADGRPHGIDPGGTAARAVGARGMGSRDGHRFRRGCGVARRSSSTMTATARSPGLRPTTRRQG